MKKPIKFFAYPLAVIAMSMFVIIGCSDDDTESKFDLIVEESPEEAGSVAGAGEYHEGEQVTIDAKPDEGYEFVEWAGDTDYVDAPTLANTTVTMPAQSISITANFQEYSDIIYGNGVIDIDGNDYVTVIIGNQEWMAENLRVTRYNNEDDIPTSLSNTDWANTTEGVFAIYDHMASNTDGINSTEEMVAAYGKLYNWHAATDPRGLCPEGWSVPADDDWTQLVDYVDLQGFPNDKDNPSGAGNALKSCWQNGSPLSGCNTSKHPLWNSDDTHHGFDSFGFSALPGGSRRTDGNYVSLGTLGRWWSSTESSSTNARYRFIYHYNGNVYRFINHKSHAFSLRCIRKNVRTEDD